MHADSPDVAPGVPSAALPESRALPARLRERAEALSVSHAAGALIAAGVVLRLARYLHYRSLWLDEATLALNVMSRSYSDLFGSLDFDQGAPAGFLVLEKLVISVFGDGERAFRLVPFVAGVASVFVFWRVASRFLDRYAALLALAFFSFAEPMIYYSAETRSYELDVLAALVLVLLFDRALETRSFGRFAAFAAAGTIAPWFSFGSLFVLAGTVFAAIVVAGVRRDLRLALLAAGAGAAWLVSFGIEYAAVVQHLHHLAGVVAGINPQASSLVKDVYLVLSEPGPLQRTLTGLANLLVAIGALTLGRRSWPRLVALLGILLAALGAGLIHRYPASGRWILYLVPLALLLLAEGAVALIRSTQMPVRAVAAGAVAALFAVTAGPASLNAIRLPTHFAGTPAVPEPAKQLIDAVATAWRPGDVLYVSRRSEFAFRYYLTCHECNARSAEERRLWPFTQTGGPAQDAAAFLPAKPSLVLGSSDFDFDLMQADFEKLRGKPRVWFLFTDQPNLPAVERMLQRDGRELRAFRAGSAEAVLFAFRKPSAP